MLGDATSRNAGIKLEIAVVVSLHPGGLSLVMEDDPDRREGAVWSLGADDRYFFGCKYSNAEHFILTEISGFRTCEMRVKGKLKCVDL